jgi:phosphoribosyl-ATP pyrophosphohydrolase
LLGDPALLRAKLIEEARELSDAPMTDAQHVAAEAADLLYFTLVAATRGGVTLADIERELDRRSLALRRRPGNAKT